MKILYIDLETSGLDKFVDQILQVGVLYDTMDGPLDDMKQIEFNVLHDRIMGQPTALYMNKKIINEIAKGNGAYPGFIAERITTLLEPTDKTVIIGGKNPHFDIGFLAELPNFAIINSQLTCDLGWRAHHRVVDPTMMYVCPTDQVPPNLNECLRRAQIPAVTNHTALDDCRLTAMLVRKKMGIEI